MRAARRRLGPIGALLLALAAPVAAMEIDDAPPSDVERSRPSVDDAPPSDVEPSQPSIDDAPPARYQGSRPSIDDAPAADAEMDD